MIIIRVDRFLSDRFLVSFRTPRPRIKSSLTTRQPKHRKIWPEPMQLCSPNVGQRPFEYARSRIGQPYAIIIFHRNYGIGRCARVFNLWKSQTLRIRTRKLKNFTHRNTRQRLYVPIHTYIDIYSLKQTLLFFCVHPTKYYLWLTR